MQNAEIAACSKTFYRSGLEKSHAKYGIKNDPPNGKNCDREAAS